MGSPFVNGANQTVFHHPCVKKRPDEFKHSLIGYPCRDSGHKQVVINSVEKLFEVDVNHIIIALGDVTLRLGYCLMGRASRSESIAVLGERRVPLLLENLQKPLLDQSVDDTRHTEFSDPAIRLRDIYPFDRLRAVGSFEQLFPNG